MPKSSKKAAPKAMTKSSSPSARTSKSGKRAKSSGTRAKGASRVMTKSLRRGQRQKSLQPKSAGPSIIKPNIYFLVYVFNKKDLPPPPDLTIKTKPTFHFREYADGKNVTPLTARVWDRIAEMTALGYDNSDTVVDSSSDSDYEVRIVDLSNLQDNNQGEIQRRFDALAAQGYYKALHWRLVCATVRPFA